MNFNTMQTAKQNEDREKSTSFVLVSSHFDKVWIIMLLHVTATIVALAHFSSAVRGFCSDSDEI